MEEPSSERLITEIQQEFQCFRVVPKASSRAQRAIDLGLKIATFWGQRRYLSEYHTVFGDTLYVPTAWDHASELDRCIVLRHERVHLRQRRRYGSLLMAFLYLVPFFPLGLAYGRARLEWEAYRETLRATAELAGLDAARSPELRKKILRRFTGPDYGWMWPFAHQVSRWYDEAIHALETERAGARPIELTPDGERSS